MNRKIAAWSSRLNQRFARPAGSADDAPRTGEDDLLRRNRGRGADDVQRG